MHKVPTLSQVSHWRTAFVVNSGPLSERLESGRPCWTNNSGSRKTTSSARRWRATSMARHLRVVLIQNGQQAQRASLLGPCRNELVGPDMMAVLRPQPKTRALIQPHPTSFRLFLGRLQPLLAPNPLDPCMVHLPALRMKQGRTPAIPIPPIPPCESHHCRRQWFFIVTGVSLIPLGRSRLPQHLTRTSLRYA